MERKFYIKSFGLIAVIVATIFCCLCFSNNFDNYNVQAMVMEKVQEELVGDPIVSSAVSVMGDVSGAGRYAVGDQVSISASPKAGCKFVKWQVKSGEEFIDLLDNEGNVVTANPYIFTVTESVEFKAVFEFVDYYLNADFSRYFDLTEISYDYDVERFNEDNLDIYPRADINNILTDGKFYYNDIVTLNYERKSGVYVKNLSSANFSSSKYLYLIQMNTDGIIIREEIDGKSSNYSVDTARTLVDVVYDFNNYDYIIVTQQSVGGNLISSKITVKTKMIKNSTFILNATSLQTIKLKAYELVDDVENAIDYNLVASLIDFRYGYYGVDTTSSEQIYLVETNSNYSFYIKSDEFFTFKYAVTDKYIYTSSINGYYSSYMNSISFVFERKTYDVNFEEFYRDEEGNIFKVTDSWYNLSKISLYPGQTIDIDLINKNLIIDKNTAQSEVQTITVNNIYGYELFAISNDKNIDIESLDVYSTSISSNLPENVNIFIIYKKLDYNLYFNVVDKNGEISSYFRSKVLNLTSDFVANLDDNVSLTGVATVGFKILGWKLGTREAATGEFLTDLSFKFKPTTNEIFDVYYYIAIDYDYFNINFSLSSTSFADSNTPMANLSLIIVDYFTFDETTLTLEMYGKNIVNAIPSSSVKLFSQVLGTVTPETVDEYSVYNYSTDLGSVAIYKLKEEFICLEFASKVYNINSEELVNSGINKFEKVDLATKEALTINLKNQDGVYSISLINLNYEDLILMTSQAVSDLYRYSYYTADGKSSLSINYTTNFANAGLYHFYVYNKPQDVSVTASYSYASQTVRVMTSNSSAYELKYINCTTTSSGNFSQNATEQYIEVSAETNSYIKIAINVVNINLGYSFKGMIKQSLSTDFTETELKTSYDSKTNQYYLQFLMAEFSGSNIIIEFEEIVYTVNLVCDINPPIEILWTSNIKNEPQIVTGKFEIKITDLVNSPTVFINSKNGYYVSNAYINFDIEGYYLSSLIGNNFEQTNSSFAFGLTSFELFIINNIDENNSVTLYLEQTERTYSVAVFYKLEGADSAFYSSPATISTTYNDQSKTSNGVYQEFDGEKGYIALFEDIKFGTELQLTVNDDNVDGLYFYNWTKVAGAILTNIKTFSLTVEDNTSICVNFQMIIYHINFVSVNEKGVADNRGNAFSSVTGSLTTSIKYGDKVEITVSEDAGYMFQQLYYKKNYMGKYFDGFTYIGVDENAYNYVIPNFIPQTFFANTKTEQMSSLDERTLIIYLEYKEKTYTISQIAKNVTSNGSNPTGKEVSSWIDEKNFLVKYDAMDDGVYVEKIADENGVIAYSTNSAVEVHFNSSFYGISFVRAEIGDESFYIQDIGTMSIAGQNIELLKDEDLGDNYYILRFKLSGDLLSSCGTSNNLELSLCYKVKQYKITLKTDERLMGSTYKISLSYQQGISGSSSYNAVSKNNVYYGTKISWMISSADAINGFNDKYYFQYFQILDTKFKVYDYNFSETPPISIQFSMADIYLDEITYWDLVANETEIVIYASYAPKITLNSSMFSYDSNSKTFTKTTTYTAKTQALKSSYDGLEDNKTDVIYDTALGGITITYNGYTSEPINANSYNIEIFVDGVIFSQKVVLVIEKRLLTLQYSGLIINKVYDGSNTLTEQNSTFLKSQFSLNGLQQNEAGITDSSDINFDNFSGYYTSNIVGESIDIVLNGITIGSSLTTNYIFGDDVLAGYLLTGKGVITKRPLTFENSQITFSNIVYKAGYEPQLKYTLAETLSFKDSLPNELGDEVLIDRENLMFSLIDYSIGENRAVTVNLSQCLIGADSNNYSISDINYYINIHPYELTTKLENIGTFKIVDLDEKCIIPIGISQETGLTVTYIDSTNSLYPDLFSQVENRLQNDERVYAFYEFVVTTTKGNSIDINSLAGAYICMPEINDFKNLYDLGAGYENLATTNKDDCLLFKISEDCSGEFVLLVNKSYFAVWRIVLIVGTILLLLLLLIIGFIIYKKIRKNKYSQNDKIY